MGQEEDVFLYLADWASTDNDIGLHVHRRSNLMSRSRHVCGTCGLPLSTTVSIITVVKSQRTLD